MSHRILLIDDEDDILEFIRYNLTKAGYEVYTARNGAEGLQQAAAHRPHLILLDMMMPVMDGIETCRALRRDPALKETMVVFLSALGEEEQQLAGFGAGADDYIPKPIKPKLLLSRIQAILKRVAADKPASLVIDRERHLVIRDGERIELPRKEFALLALLASSPGKLFSREEIYSRIWGDTVVVGDRTIDVHVRKIRQKIGNGHISTVKGLGYKYETSTTQATSGTPTINSKEIEDLQYKMNRLEKELTLMKNTKTVVNNSVQNVENKTANQPKLEFKPEIKKIDTVKLGEPVENWPKIVDQIKQAGKISLYTNLLNSTANKINDMTVGIKFERGITPFGKTILERPENMNEIVRQVSIEMAQPMRVVLLDNNDTIASSSDKFSNIAKDIDAPINIIE